MLRLTDPHEVDSARDFLNHGRLPEAERIAVRINERSPGDVSALCLLAHAAYKQRDYRTALAYAGQAVAACPGFAMAHSLRGIALVALDQPEEGLEALQRAVTLHPCNTKFLGELAIVQWRFGMLEETYRTCRALLAVDPQDAESHSNLAVVASDLFADDPMRILEEHREWARMHEDGLVSQIRPHENNRDPDRPLKIGYLSPFSGPCAAMHFIEPLLSAHDRDQFDITYYWSAQSRPQSPEEHRCVSSAHRWEHVRGLTDAQLAERIRQDKIDILVDLWGHLPRNRLGVFCRKPAPVQVSAIGYTETTGIRAMDYRISDALADPPGMTDSHYTEKIFRLPRTGYCYRPPEECPPVSALPALKNGHITFGSTNRVLKMTQETIACWSAVMKRVPGSRMVIRANDLSYPILRNRVLGMFHAHGIGSDRLELLGWTTMEEYLQTFDRMDVVLDTFPFAGHTVSCHALWMGVPVVTRVGQRHVSRMGLSILQNVGLGELVTSDATGFVNRAVQVAHNLPYLQNLRQSLRGRMASSPLMDERGYSRDMARAYREMWRTWCVGQSPRDASRGFTYRLGRGEIVRQRSLLTASATDR